jgi:hypothetical protein
MTGVADFIVNSVVGVLLFVAFCAFMVNAFRYFIMQSTTEEGREKAKRFMLWSIIGFVTIISIQGFIMFIRDGLSLGNSPVTPDYMENRPSSSTPNTVGLDEGGNCLLQDDTSITTSTKAECKAKNGTFLGVESATPSSGTSGTAGAKCMKNGMEIPLSGCVAAGGVVQWPAP